MLSYLLTISRSSGSSTVTTPVCDIPNTIVSKRYANNDHYNAISQYLIIANKYHHPTIYQLVDLQVLNAYSIYMQKP